MAEISVLELNDLRGILQNFDGMISPLACLPPLSVSPEKAGAGGKTSESGKTPAFLKETIEVISRANHLKKFTALLPGGSLMTGLIYTAPEMKPIGLIVDDNGSVSLCDEAGCLNHVLTFFPEDSPAGEKDFDCRLDFREGLILTALLEASGKPDAAPTHLTIASTLAPLLEGQTPDPAALPPAPAALLMGLYGGPLPDDGWTEEALARLEKIGLVVRAGNGWRLASRWMPYAGRSADPGPAVYLNKSALKEGALESMEMLIIPAGGGWLAFQSDPIKQDQVDLTAYPCLPIRSLLHAFFSSRSDHRKEPASDPKRTTLPEKATGKVLIAMVLGILSLCLACGGCSLVIWALNMK